MDRWRRLLESGKLNAISPVLASRLNRDDLNGFSPSPAVDPYSNPLVAVGASGTLAGISAAASMDSGRVSAAMLGALVIGGGAFYIWTRRHQA